MMLLRSKFSMKCRVGHAQSSRASGRQLRAPHRNVSERTCVQGAAPGLRHMDYCGEFQMEIAVRSP